MRHFFVSPHGHVAELASRDAAYRATKRDAAFHFTTATRDDDRLIGQLVRRVATTDNQFTAQQFFRLINHLSR